MKKCNDTCNNIFNEKYDTPVAIIKTKEDYVKVTFNLLKDNFKTSEPDKELTKLSSKAVNNFYNRLATIRKHIKEYGKDNLIPEFDEETLKKLPKDIETRKTFSHAAEVRASQTARLENPGLGQ